MKFFQFSQNYFLKYQSQCIIKITDVPDFTNYKEFVIFLRER